MKKTTNFWKGTSVLVTGGTGFIGSHVVDKLVELEAKVTVFDRLTTGTLKHVEHLKNCITVIKGDCSNIGEAIHALTGQSVVMNLAAHVGGIEYNRTHQATLFRDNVQIGITMLEAARIAKVERFLVVSSACVYPHDAVIPTKESEGFRSEPEPTNGGYGWSKRMAEKAGMYYAEEFGMKVGIVRPYNSYGPRDHFDVQSSHVIPALIKRVLDGENPIKVWGSGNQTRAFLYVEDLAMGMIKAIEEYPVPDPINLGTDEEVSIKELIEMIRTITKKSPTVLFDTSKPDGSPRRNSDNTNAKKRIGFQSQTPFIEGLKKTIEWYISQQTSL